MGSSTHSFRKPFLLPRTIENYSCNVEEISTDENDVVRIRSSFSCTILLFVRSLVFVAFPLVLIR